MDWSMDTTHSPATTISGPSWGLKGYATGAKMAKDGK
jgi:hypothetical protein